MTKPLSKVSLQVQENERQRAIEIVEEIYGGHPTGTVGWWCCEQAKEQIKGEDDGEQ